MREHFGEFRALRAIYVAGLLFALMLLSFGDARAEAACPDISNWRYCNGIDRLIDQLEGELRAKYGTGKLEDPDLYWAKSAVVSDLKRQYAEQCICVKEKEPEK